MNHVFCDSTACVVCWYCCRNCSPGQHFQFGFKHLFYCYTTKQSCTQRANQDVSYDQTYYTIL
jgi:hypothetical protein